MNQTQQKQRARRCEKAATLDQEGSKEVEGKESIRHTSQE